MVKKYTAAQQDAIDARHENSLIIACAGSGKTEVVAKSIAHLVADGVQKSSIVAFTFTERAAAELKARIRERLDEAVPTDPALGDMYVGTIHSFCLQLLKDLDPKYRSFSVMDEEQQAAFIVSNYFFNPEVGKGIGLDQLRSRTRTGGYWDAVRTFITTMNVMHQKGIPTADLKDEVLKETISRYTRLAHDPPNLFFDFNAIIDELINLLESRPAILRNVRNMFTHIIVDEYQDVDPRQEHLIALLSNTGKDVTVTVVGDDDQSIYGWRGADISNILTFEARYPNVTRIELEDNFRSTHAIVEIANSAIRKIPAAHRLGKEMVARHWDSETGLHRETIAEHGDVSVLTFAEESEEADWVAQRILDLRGAPLDRETDSPRGLDFGDVAILLRSVKNSGQSFVEALKKYNIPYVVKGTKGLFSQPEVRLIHAAFCQLARHEMLYSDDDNIVRLSVDEGRTLIRDLTAYLTAEGAMLTADGSKFLEWIARKRKHLDRQNLPQEQRGRLSRRIYPQDIFQEMLHELGISQGPRRWPADVMYNLGRFSRLLTNFESVHQWITPRDLGRLCLFLGGWAASNVDEGGIDELVAPNAVQIMTVHGAKGLEWPAVFIPRVSSMLFPSSRRNQGPETFLVNDEFSSKDYAVGDDGERRLWYVAITRCQKYLHVTSLDRKRKRPTPFFKEIQHDYATTEPPAPPTLQKLEPTPPAAAAFFPTTYSQLNYYWECPTDFQLRALMGFAPGVDEQYGYGEQVHNILAELHNRVMAGTKLDEHALEDIVNSRFNLRYTQGDPFKFLREAALRSIRRYLKEYDPGSRDLVVAEKSFEFLEKESGALITGSIDLLEHSDAATDDAIRIIDFKSHKWVSVAQFDDEVQKVTRQLRVYALAAGEALRLKTQGARAYFLSPKPPPDDLKAQGATDVLDIEVDQAQLDAIRAELKSAVETIKQGLAENEFERKGPRTGRCRKCDFRLICPGFAEWRKRDTSTPHPGSLQDDRESDLRAIQEDIDAG